LYLRATVREIVDFPVPARPFNQKMHRSSCLSSLSAQLYMSRRRSTRVLGRQAGSCWRSKELKGALVAKGSRLRGSSRSITCQLPFKLESERSELILNVCPYWTVAFPLA
jgi:hypothetical protein